MLSQIRKTEELYPNIGCSQEVWHLIELIGMDPAGGRYFSGRPSTDAIGPMDEFIFDDGLLPAHGALPTQGNFNGITASERFEWNALPFQHFSQPLAFNEFQQFPTQNFQDGFASSTGSTLPGLPERQVYEVEEFSSLSAQTSNESLMAADQQTRRRSSRKRRIENGYHCNELHCQEAFDTAGELTKHCYRKHTPESAWPFACQVCGKRFYDKRDFGRHENVERKRASMRAIVRQPPPGSPIDAGTTPADDSVEGPRLSSSRRESQNTKQQEQLPKSSRSQEFTRTNDHHSSAQELLEAATADLKRFVNLGASNITIKASVPSQDEPMNFSVVHAMKDTQPAAIQGKPSPTFKSPQPDTRKPESTDQETASSLRISSPDRQEVSSPISKPPQREKAITVTFRSRPAFHRSNTHPPAVRMIRVGC